MTKNDLNQIGTLINTALEPVSKKLDVLWDQTVKLTEDMDEVKEKLVSIESRVEQVDNKLDNKLSLA